MESKDSFDNTLDKLFDKVRAAINEVRTEFDDQNIPTQAVRVRRARSGRRKASRKPAERRAVEASSDAQMKTGKPRQRAPRGANYKLLVETVQKAEKGEILTPKVLSSKSGIGMSKLNEHISRAMNDQVLRRVGRGQYTRVLRRKSAKPA